MEPDRCPSEDSLRLAMDLAWRDHHHARNQTWRALQIEAVLGAGLISVDAQFHNVWGTACAGILVIIAATFGIMISLNHRKLERRKFAHILNCEEKLGLHRADVIPLAEKVSEYERSFGNQRDLEIMHAGIVGMPAELGLRDVLNFGVNNTAIFIVRMHWAIIAFAVLVILFRCLS